MGTNQWIYQKQPNRKETLTRSVLHGHHRNLRLSTFQQYTECRDSLLHSAICIIIQNLLNMTDRDRQVSYATGFGSLTSLQLRKVKPCLPLTPRKVELNALLALKLLWRRFGKFGPDNLHISYACCFMPVLPCPDAYLLVQCVHVDTALSQAPHSS